MPILMQFDLSTHPTRFPISRVLSVTALIFGMNAVAFAQNPPPAPKGTPQNAPAVTQPAAKTVLVYRAQAGQVRKGRGMASLTLSPGGQKVSLDIRESSKQTYKSVAPNGDITYEETTESSETLVNGRKPETPEEDQNKDVNTITIRPNGMLVSYTSTKEDKDDLKFQGRLYYATNIVFSEKPVGKGDKWTVDIKPNEDLGVRASKIEYEVVDTKRINDTDTVMIRFSFAENTSGGISSKGNLLIEANSGDTLSADINIEGVPLGPPGQETPATGKLITERVEGGPLPGAKNVAAARTEKKDKTIDETVKDFEKMPGILTLYRKKESNRETIYLEIPEAKLDKPYFLQVTAATGTGQEIIAGDAINDIVFKFSRNGDDKLLLITPNWQNQADPTTPIGKAVERSFSESYLQSFKIEAKQPERKSLLIDISDLFRSDFAQITRALSGGDGLAGLLGMPSGGGAGLDREKTYIRSIKNLPENLVVFTQYHFLRGGRVARGASAPADPRSLPLVVAYNLIALPNDENLRPTNGYVPRKADPRVGYFTTEYFDYTDDTRDEFINRYITRWDLRKKDPNAPLSEPEKPIVFWLDNAIPTQYREVTRRAILVWNKAFEKIGFKDAIRVEQMPDKPDFDHADLRYNVVRWVVTPPDSPRNGVAVGQLRANPLTGQILNAAVSIDAEWTHYSRILHRNLIDPAARFREGANLDMEEALSGVVPVSEELAARIARRRSGADARRCEISAGLGEKAVFGLMALDLSEPAGLTPAREKDYTEQLLLETVTHEIGHVLGLTHNFIASTQLTLEQLKNPQVVREQGISASVMDYNNFNISAIGAPGVDFYSQTVGVYDLWAIRYGYSTFAPGAETAGLKEIASQSNRPGHAYEEDITAFIGLDPRVVQYDISGQPLDYWERMLQLSRRLILTLDAREPKMGESYWEFTKRLNLLLGQYARAAGVTSRFIGGIRLNRNHRGDANEQANTLPVSVADQKRALNLLNTYVFAPTAMTLPERYYGHLTNDPYNPSFSQDQPIGDAISNVQTSAVRRVFAPSVLRRLQNAEFKMGEGSSKALTLPTLFDSVRDNIWAEVRTVAVTRVAAVRSVPPATRATPIRIPLLRRQLQRAYLDTMIDMATKPTGAPDDARMLAWEQLRQMKTRLLAARTAPTADEYTRLHLRDSLDKINRALEAKLTLGAATPSGSDSNLLRMLLGGKGP
ncbi:MAG: zinc-dependent metalloprotease [Capsulimonadales bacterium]|nr:zinc-dependent metalloprotease [Capsulimonadales bacterium]